MRRPLKFWDNVKLVLVILAAGFLLFVWSAVSWGGGDVLAALINRQVVLEERVWVLEDREKNGEDVLIQLMNLKDRLKEVERDIEKEKKLDQRQKLQW
uniref:Uncharacterized protein n=1 Tax=viral metagenome TaxID=1070528 RepID=A0A6H1ZJB6_9ZZZZ